MKSKSHKRKFASVLCTFDLDENITSETGAYCIFDVFALLAYWVNRADLKCKVQMECWNGSVLDINGTCADLGQKSCSY